jgi:putative transcriptional regulator
MPESDDDREVTVLRSKREATAYRILVEVARRQPAVSQQEIAGAVGVTAQAVSDYLSELIEEGRVRRGGRGRYEVTKEGVDWLISRTDALREYVEDVSTTVVGGVEVDAAVATGSIAAGETVALSLRDGALHAAPGDGEGGEGATAVAVGAADAGADVGVTDFEGVLDFEPGTVSIVSVPRVDDGGSRAVPADLVSEHADDHDLLAAAGVEALVAVRRADREPDLRFGTPGAVREAATRGLDVALFAVTTAVSEHTSELREAGLGYEVLDAGDRRDAE